MRPNSVPDLDSSPNSFIRAVSQRFRGNTAHCNVARLGSSLDSQNNNFVSALRLLDHHLRFWYFVSALAGVATALLDLLAIVLLVPLLAYLGQGTQPAWSQPIADALLGRDASVEAVVLTLALVAALLFVLKGIASIFLIWYQNGVLNRFQVALAKSILKRYSQAPWLTLSSVSTGSLTRTVSKGTEASAMVLGAGLQLMSEVAVLVAAFTALSFVSPLTAGVASAYLLMAGALYFVLVRRPLRVRGTEVQVAHESANTALVELAAGMKELVVRGTAHQYASRFSVAHSRFLAADRLIRVINSSLRYILEALMICGVALVVLVAVVSGSGGSILIYLGVLLAASMRLLPALNGLLVSTNMIRAFGPGVSVVTAELARLGDEPAPKESASGRAISDAVRISPVLFGVITFNNVGFTYPGRADAALSGVSVSVPMGSSLGIVGPSGAGKSTLFDLLLGLVEPHTGEILIDGEPIGDRLDEWRASIGFVPQDVFITDESIFLNVAFGDDDGLDSEARFAEATSIAHLNTVIADAPGGIDARLGERGVSLSGGQRQRIGLARALFRRPTVLLLDEATSALDNHTESQISEALEELRGAMTMFVIAHRLSTVKSCDQIIYLENGCVQGIGTYQQLCDGNSEFVKLVQLGAL